MFSYVSEFLNKEFNMKNLVRLLLMLRMSDAGIEEWNVNKTYPNRSALSIQYPFIITVSLRNGSQWKVTMS